MYYKTDYQSPMGKITIASDGSNLIGLWITRQKYFMNSVTEPMEEKANLPVFKETKNWLDRYFAKKQPHISELPLAPQGSDFRQKVWKILCEIPYGKTITYGDIAKELQQGKMSAQAVGGAVGHNPISIIIPCHRVVGTNGNLTGYAGGLDLKIKLLKHEDMDMTQFYIPKKGTAL